MKNNFWLQLGVILGLYTWTMLVYEAGRRTMMIEAIDLNLAQYNPQTSNFEWKVQ